MNTMLRVKPLHEKYRGFELGYTVGLHGWLKAAWRSSMEDAWHEGSIYVDTVAEVVPLAKECIDFNYRVEATEAVLGRSLTISELTPDL